MVNMLLMIFFLSSSLYCSDNSEEKNFSCYSSSPRRLPNLDPIFTEDTEYPEPLFPISPFFINDDSFNFSTNTFNTEVAPARTNQMQEAPDNNKTINFNQNSDNKNNPQDPIPFHPPAQKKFSISHSPKNFFPIDPIFTENEKYPAALFPISPSSGSDSNNDLITTMNDETATVTQPVGIQGSTSASQYINNEVTNFDPKASRHQNNSDNNQTQENSPYFLNTATPAIKPGMTLYSMSFLTNTNARNTSIMNTSKRKLEEEEEEEEKESSKPLHINTFQLNSVERDAEVTYTHSYKLINQLSQQIPNPHNYYLNVAEGSSHPNVTIPHAAAVMAAFSARIHATKSKEYNLSDFQKAMRTGHTKFFKHQETGAIFIAADFLNRSLCTIIFYEKGHKYKCTISNCCNNQIFNDIKELSKHMSEIFSNGIIDESKKLFHCKFCPNSSNFDHRLITHLKNQHPNILKELTKEEKQLCIKSNR